MGRYLCSGHKKPPVAARLCGLAVFVAVAVTSMTVARADITIDTIASASGPVSPFGTPDSGATPTYGELFVDPAGNPFLQSMTFDVANGGATAIPFQAYVYAWNGTSITGSALFTSAAQSIAPSGSTFSLFTVGTGGVALTPGNSYVAFFSTIGFTGPSGSGSMQLAPAASYPAGNFEYNNSATFAGLLANSPPWNQFGNFGNLAFRLVFTSGQGGLTPEPSSFALASIGGVMSLGWWLRRRRAQAK
ncbi:MAG TPA: hypothetical protein VGY53_01865 [Isosphaeraceae bacterium]|nr:hypothetical protein [Isosphaeraceae bacterium]